MKTINFYFVLVPFLLLKIGICAFLFLNKDWSAITDGDLYMELFQRFISNGAYFEIEKGTSVMYNFALYPIYLLVGDVKETFIIFNSLCIVLTIILGVYLLYKISIRFDIHIYFTYFLCSIYIFYIISQKFINILANDDSFMGLLYLIIIYFSIKNIESPKHYYFSVIGFILGLCLGTREIAILFFPFVLYMIFYSNAKVKNLIYFVIPLIFTILIIHFPSIIAGNGLSFYNKNPEDVNWIQKNHLAITEIEKSTGIFNIKPWSIWRANTFDDVREYLKQNGENSLPKSFLDVVFNHPMQLIKMTLFNLLFLFKFYFKAIGGFILIPLIFLFRKNFFLLPFLYFCFIFCFVAYSHVELRWLSGIEMMFFISVLTGCRYLKLSNNKLLLIIIIAIIPIIFNDIKFLYYSL